MFNWASYNESLVRRGEIILDFGIIDGWYDELERMNQGKRGGAYGYPDSFVQLLGYAVVDVKWVAMEDASRSTSRNASGCPHNNSLGVPNAFTILRFFSSVWSWYNDRRKTNAGHMAIANLQHYREASVITQNIDGLHQIAGSREVIELHGNIFATKCTKCDFRGNIGDEFSDLPPSCKICGSYLRPDVVRFGESIKQEVWKEAVKRSMTCDVMIIVGTSLVVSPASLYDDCPCLVAMSLHLNNQRCLLGSLSQATRCLVVNLLSISKIKSLWDMLNSQ